MSLPLLELLEKLELCIKQAGDSSFVGTPCTQQALVAGREFGLISHDTDLKLKVWIDNSSIRTVSTLIGAVVPHNETQLALLIRMLCRLIHYLDWDPLTPLTLVETNKAPYGRFALGGILDCLMTAGSLDQRVVEKGITTLLGQAIQTRIAALVFLRAYVKSCGESSGLRNLIIELTPIAASADLVASTLAKQCLEWL